MQTKYARLLVLCVFLAITFISIYPPQSMSVIQSDRVLIGDATVGDTLLLVGVLGSLASTASFLMMKTKEYRRGKH